MALKVNGVTVIDDSLEPSFANFGILAAPQILAPSNNEPSSALSNNIIISEFIHIYGSGEGTKTEDVITSNVQYQVSNNYSFTDIYFDSGYISPINTTLDFDSNVQLSLGTTYFARARYGAYISYLSNPDGNVYSNSNVTSSFSPIVSFTTVVFQV